MTTFKWPWWDLIMVGSGWTRVCMEQGCIIKYKNFSGSYKLRACLELPLDIVHVHKIHQITVLAVLGYVARLWLSDSGSKLGYFVRLVLLGQSDTGERGAPETLDDRIAIYLVNLWTFNHPVTPSVVTSKQKKRKHGHFEIYEAC